MRILLLTTALALSAPAVMAQSTHSHGHNQSGSETKSGDHEYMAGVHAEAKINSIDGNTVNVSHGPIPDIGWPSMTMDLTLLEGAKVGDVKPGDTAMMMLEQGADGIYGIRALMPMK
ncbi:MAG: copper-binding protein [Pseudomonadota bacterium]